MWTGSGTRKAQGDQQHEMQYMIKKGENSILVYKTSMAYDRHWFKKTKSYSVWTAWNSKLSKQEEQAKIHVAVKCTICRSLLHTAFASLASQMP